MLDTGIRLEGEGDRRGVVRGLDVVVAVLDRHLQWRGCSGSHVLVGARLGGEDQLRSRSRGVGELEVGRGGSGCRSRDLVWAAGNCVRSERLRHLTVAPGRVRDAVRGVAEGSAGTTRRCAEGHGRAADRVVVSVGDRYNKRSERLGHLCGLGRTRNDRYRVGRTRRDRLHLCRRSEDTGHGGDRRSTRDGVAVEEAR